MIQYVLTNLEIDEEMYVSLYSWIEDNFQSLVVSNQIRVIEASDTIIKFKRIR